MKTPLIYLMMIVTLTACHQRPHPENVVLEASVNNVDKIQKEETDQALLSEHIREKEDQEVLDQAGLIQHADLKNRIQLTSDDWALFIELEDADEAQKVIDQYPELASTANTGAFDPYANYSHHFVGHVYGAFAPVLQLDVGDVVTVYDAFGMPYQYEIDFKQKYAYKDPNLPQILDELINSQDPGIILQTCANLSQSQLYFLHGSLLPPIIDKD